jgi:hypothetical protein
MKLLIIKNACKYSPREKEGLLHCSNGKENEGDKRQSIACSRIAITFSSTTAIAEADKGQA